MSRDSVTRRMFTFEQIEQRVAARQHIPGYRDILMESAIETTPTGVVFNIRHPSFLRLIKLVQKADDQVDDVAVSPRRLRSSLSDNSIPPRPINTRSISNSFESSSIPIPNDTNNLETFDLDREIAQPVPNLSRIRKHCSVDAITNANRATLWTILLEGKPTINVADLQLDLKDCEFDLFNQRVIRMDIQRTRPDVDFFRNNEGVRDALETILTVFCKRHLINYKQGINYIAAPFVYVFGIGRTKDAYLGLSSFIKRFCPNTFTDDQFGGLQCIFRVFRALLMYHDPKLANFLDENDMSPELYASPWFMTIFANRVAFPPLLRLWDQLMFHEEPLILYFLAVALLISNSASLLKQSAVVLPEHLTQLTMQSVGLVDQLFSLAEALLANTPISFLTFFKTVVSQNITVDSPVYERILSLECVHVSAQEIINHCYPEPDAKQEDRMKFFVVDCRPEHHYNSGHLPFAYHLDPALYLEPDQLARRVEILSSMTGSHFVFLLDKHDARSRQQFMGLQLFFIQKGFKYVSSCQGGYSACHDLVMSCMGKIELVDHKSSRCIDCMTAKRESDAADPRSPFKHRFFSAVRSRVIGAQSLNKETTSEGAPVGSPTVEQLDDVTPESATCLEDSIDLRLLTCGLRDSSASPQQYTACAQRICTKLVASALNRIDIQLCDLTTPNGFAFSSCRLERAVVALTLSVEAFHCLQECLSPFNATGRISVGLLRFNEEYIKEADGVLRAHNVIDCTNIPDGAVPGLCHVLIFMPVAETSLLLQPLLNALKNRGLSGSSTTILSLLSVRPCVARLSQSFPEIRFISAAMDRLTRGKADPGALSFDNMYMLPEAFTSRSITSPLSSPQR